MSLFTTSESVADVKVLSISFSTWVKAGIAFAIGAGVVDVVAKVLWWLFVANLITGLARALSH